MKREEAARAIAIGCGVAGGCCLFVVLVASSPVIAALAVGATILTAICVSEFA